MLSKTRIKFLELISTSHPTSSTKSLMNIIIESINRIPPSTIEIERSISEVHRNFHQLRELELILEEKSRVRGINSVRFESSDRLLITLWKSCLSDLDLPTNELELNQGIKKTYELQFNCLEKLLDWISSNSNIHSLVDRQFLNSSIPSSTSLKPPTKVSKRPPENSENQPPFPSTSTTSTTTKSNPTLSTNHLLPKSYPPIQPLKGAAQFTKPNEEFGDWLILLSGQSIRDFRQLKDGKLFKTVQGKLGELSCELFD